MRVGVIGAGGFLGRGLVGRIAASGRLFARHVDELVLFDRRLGAIPADPACTVTRVQGDIRDAAVMDLAFGRPLDVVFHLAATLTAPAEREFREGIDTNVLAFLEILERCRVQASTPTVVFVSSIATFGGDLPDVVGDDVFQSPTTSYGTHKAIGELLLADYSRHGFVDGRALRLPIIVTHPGPANGTISDQLSSLIRDGLRGDKLVCRIRGDSAVVLASVGKAIDGLLRLADTPSSALNDARILNLPGVTVTPNELLAAVAAFGPGGRVLEVERSPDPEIQRIVDGWPKAFTSARALALGFTPDASAESLVAAYATTPARHDTSGSSQLSTRKAS